MKINIILFSLLFLISCSAQVVDQKQIEAKQQNPVNEISQTLNVSYLELFPLIHKIFSLRGIPIDKTDPNIGRLVSSIIPLVDKKSSIPLNCDVVIKITAKPYKEKSSIIRVSYREQCDGLEASDVKLPNAEKLILSLVEDIKEATGVVK